MMANSGEYTQDVYQRRSQIAQKLLEQARGNPSRNWAEGLGNLSETALGGFQQAKADAQQKIDEYKGKKDLNEALGLPPPPPPNLGSSGASQIAGVFGMDWPSADAPAAAPQLTGPQKIAALFSGGGGAPAASPAAASAAGLPSDQASYAPPAVAPPAPTTFRPGIAAPSPAAAPQAAPDYGKAIAGIESGGAYDKLGPQTKTGDRAYGKYQVMGNNIPEWTTQVLGKPMTPEQFLANPDAQEAVFKAKFGEYVQKYGPEGAAKAWFAGEKGMNNPNAKDVLGTTVAGYGQKFTQALGPQADPNASPLDNMPWPHGNVGAPQIASALTAPTGDAALPPGATPAQGALPTAEAVRGAPGGILADVPQDKKLQIAQMLTSTNPTVKAMGMSMIQQMTKPETTDEIKEYNLAKKQGFTGSFFDFKTGLKKAGATNVTTNVGGGSDKQIFDAMDESAKAARTIATGLTGLREARAAVEGGAILGAGADMRLGLQKVGALLGADPSKIVNTETFRAAIAPQVAAVLKSTVGTTNISNTDREFAEKAAGGNINLDEKSITRLMDIMERASMGQLEAHQKRLDKVYADPEKFGRERALFGVDMPAVPVRAAPAAGKASDTAAPAAPAGALEEARRRGLIK